MTTKHTPGPWTLTVLKDLLDLGRAGFIRGEDIAVTRAVNEARAILARIDGEGGDVR